MPKVKYQAHALIFYSCMDCQFMRWVTRNNSFVAYKCCMTGTKVKGKIALGAPIPDNCPLPKVKVLEDK